MIAMSPPGDPPREPNPITWPAVALVAVLVVGVLGIVYLTTR